VVQAWSDGLPVILSTALVNESESVVMASDWARASKKSSIFPAVFLSYALTSSFPPATV
jgi:hypothetical protein